MRIVSKRHRLSTQSSPRVLPAEGDAVNEDEDEKLQLANHSPRQTAGEHASTKEEAKRFLQGDTTSDAARLWGPVLLLGPFLPAMLAMLTIVVGSTILHADRIDKKALQYCGYPIDKFLSAGIATSYVLLLVFAWSFMGFAAGPTIRGRRWCIVQPFASLQTLVTAYSVPLIMSLAVWVYGSWAVGKVRGRI